MAVTGLTGLPAFFIRSDPVRPVGFSNRLIGNRLIDNEIHKWNGVRNA
jgi:hypothetical protein